MTIRPRLYPSGRKGWQLDLGVVGGKRKQKSFPTEAAAIRARDKMLKAQERHGDAAMTLTPQEMAEIVVARDRLQEVGATLHEAVEFYFLHAPTSTRKLVVADLVQEFRDEKLEECSTRYHRQLGVSLGAFARAFGTRDAKGITREEIEAWSKSGRWAPKTRDNYIGDVSAMYAWAKKFGIKINPTSEIRRAAKPGDGEIGTLTMPQCVELLLAAVQDPTVIGFVVLGLFGGLRPAEIQRLDWSAVDLHERHVVVEGKQAKTRRRRVVDLSEHAVAWILASNVKREGKITRTWWAGRWRLFRRKLGYDVGNGDDGLSRYARVKPRAEIASKYGEWPHNALRHTFASMHYAHYQNEAKLQVQMGHESAEMLHQHYRAVKTRKEAAAFWDLGPCSPMPEEEKKEVAGAE